MTGATGNVGRTLVQSLAAAGEQVTAVSRGTAEPALPGGVRHQRADLTAAETLAPAFVGATALFLHDTGISAHLMDPRAILALAKSAGIQRVVRLSSQGVATRPESASHGQLAHSFEEAVRESGLEWTILRPGGFASNAYAWAESVRDERVVAAPFGDVGLPVVDPFDIAEVAAVALREDGHAGQVYTLTGPALSTPRQRAEDLAAALGEPVRFVEQTRAQAKTQMLHFMPEPVVETTLDILGNPTPEEQLISPDIDKVLGRAPHAFSDWAQRNMFAFK
ncbi:SDR family oxidoreductase [Nocardia sp. NPDC058666]|uniref:SDR family oxidoreductase n=1 Tax=Nocardia sp. NPDC058666 TaxID=3346587 RepID=UPI003659478B